MLRLFALLAALPVAAIAVAAPAFAASDDDLRKAIVGTWSNAADCSGPLLVFNADGTFVQVSADDRTDRTNGTYTIANGRLSGSSEGNDMPSTGLTYDGTHLAFQYEDGTSDPMNPCPALAPLPAQNDTAAPAPTPAAPAPTAPAQ
jgi:hypothetical protein